VLDDDVQEHAEDVVTLMVPVLRACDTVIVSGETV
jgi:hypothetical protein